MRARVFSLIGKIFETNTLLSYCIVFEIAFIIFYFLQNQLTFADPDSFYHTKMAILMKEGGIVREFPWLQFAVIKDYYTDHHLLYHIFLLPFIAILPPLVGVKLATIIFSSFAVTLFFWLLKKFEVKGAWAYVFILALSASFIFRINLAKAQSLALSAYFFGIYLVDQKKYYWLILFSFLYVWLYGGWPLIFVISFAYLISGILLEYSLFEKNLGSRWKNIFFGHEYRLNGKSAWKWICGEYPVFLYVLLGALFGIVVNPYFPKNILFYWEQIFKIAVVGARNVIGVGGEWYSYNPVELLASGSVAFILLVVAITFFVLMIRKQSRRSVMLLLLTILFFVLTVRSRRNVEYLIPTMLLFSAVSLSIFSREMNMKGFVSELKIFLQEQKVFLVLFVIPLMLIPYIVARDYLAVRASYSSGQEFHKFEEPMEWLKKNSRAGSIVFHSDWDEFPILFYHNIHNYYIVGLDPTFLYSYDKELYRKFKEVTTGEEKSDIYRIIKNDFRAEYVFVSLSGHEEFDKNLQNNIFFEEVYSDEKAKIYKVL